MRRTSGRLPLSFELLLPLLSGVVFAGLLVFLLVLREALPLLRAISFSARSCPRMSALVGFSGSMGSSSSSKYSASSFAVTLCDLLLEVVTATRGLLRGVSGDATMRLADCA
jgi:hypothetical protein